MVTFGYQRYQVLHDSMLCTWSMGQESEPEGELVLELGCR